MEDMDVLVDVVDSDWRLDMLAKAGMFVWVMVHRVVLVYYILELDRQLVVDIWVHPDKQLEHKVRHQDKRDEHWVHLVREELLPGLPLVDIEGIDVLLRADFVEDTVVEHNQVLVDKLMEAHLLGLLARVSSNELF